MRYTVSVTRAAASHIRAFAKFEQRTILDAIEAQLRSQPEVETRNRKRLDDNELSEWELHVGEFRVFYTVVLDNSDKVVTIIAVGRKKHNVLYIGGKEVTL